MSVVSMPARAMQGAGHRGARRGVARAPGRGRLGRRGQNISHGLRVGGLLVLDGLDGRQILGAHALGQSLVDGGLELAREGFDSGEDQAQLLVLGGAGGGEGGMASESCDMAIFSLAWLSRMVSRRERIRATGL